MADTMKLIGPGFIILFSPTIGYTKPDDLRAIHMRARSGTLYSYKIHYKRRWSVPVAWFDVNQADYVNAWWCLCDTIEFYPDEINTPGYYVDVRITNSERPLLATADYQWENLFEGTLELSQV